MKSKNHPKMTEDDLSDTEVEFDNHAEPKELELSDKRIETAQNKKALKQISKLKSWFNPDSSRFMEVQDSGRDLVIESANFAFNSLDLVEEPKTFAEAFLIQMTKSNESLEENSEVGHAQRLKLH
jgi:hypothetical protein